MNAAIEDHPQLYREATNHPEKIGAAPKVCEGCEGCTQATAKAPATQPTPDLFPAAIREIENHGTPEQVAALHRAEQTH
ncbi:hypothetical protein HK105_206527 [Polyrhizophydium stewartii]|uniref:Uncharacterized protein n=1 Tax=Polyrhizophydium stewartii TaxID=2732419 RepID=A0ABR4N382_9FUNG|nr:hypothetical protein HK105_004796 [Polyrhizophydium stewartii]